MGKLMIIAAVAALAASHTSLQPDSKLWVEGGSTVRDWKCTATAINSRIETNDNAELSALVTNGQVNVPVSKLDCGNGKMNEHMRKALKAETNVDIQFALRSYKVADTHGTLYGTLTIAGTPKDIEIPATIREEGTTVRVRANKQIKMTEWGVKPPSLMLGTMKVKDVVTVGFDVTLKR